MEESMRVREEGSSTSSSNQTESSVRGENNQMEESMRMRFRPFREVSPPFESIGLVEMYTRYNYTELEKKMERWNKTSIYQVPAHIKDKEGRSAYEPQLVKLGAFHHANEYHLRGHKDRALLHLVKRADKPIDVFVDAVMDVAEQLEAAYDLHLIRENWPEDGGARMVFVEKMVLDGCFLLEAMRMIELKGEVPDYAPNDPVFSKHGYLYLKNVIIADMLMMVNQLPMLLLETLARHVPSERCQDVGDMVKNMVVAFFGLPFDNSCHLGGHSLHPIDIARKILCAESGRSADEWRMRIPCGESERYEDTMPSALELYEAGIHFKAIRSRSLLDIDFDFQRGVLSMPVLRVHNYVETVFINLLTFEQLHPGAGNGVTEYLIFMDHIIDSAKDVALLRSKGVLDCALGSDKEVAELFNTLSKGAVMDPSNKLQEVRQSVNAYCRKTWPKWRASFLHTYFRNPWVFFSLVAAAVLLVATLLQTIFTIKP